MKNLLLKNSFYALAGQILILILGFFFAGMTISYLGSSKAGFFILLTTIYGWVQLAGGGAFHAAAVREIAINDNNKEEVKEIVKSVISVNVLAGLPIALGTLWLFPIIFSWSQMDSSTKFSAYYVVIFTSIAFLIDQYSSALKAVYEGYQKFNIITSTRLFTGLFGNLSRLLILYIYKDMVYLSVITLIIAIIGCLLDLYIVFKMIGFGIFPGWNLRVIRSFFTLGIWTWLGNTGNVIFFNFTSIVLTKNVGTSALMFVSLPQTIVLSIGQFIINSTYVIFPALANTKEYSIDVIKRIDDRFRWFISFISFAVYTGIFIAAPFILKVVVNEEFSLKSSPVLMILCLYGIIWSQEVFNIFSTMAVGKGHANTIVHLAVSISTLIVTIILIPKFGYLGYPIAQLIKLPGVIWHMIWSRKILKLDISFKSITSPYFSPAIASLFWIFVMYIYTYYFNQNIIYQFILYLFSAFLFLIIVIKIEKIYFSKYNRLSVLESIISLLLHKYLPKFEKKLIHFLK